MCDSVAMRLKHSPLAYLWLCALSTSCAHFSTIDTVPKAFSSRLGAHPVWITVTTFDNPPGTFPPSETSVVKKWEVREKKGRAVLMREQWPSMEDVFVPGDEIMVVFSAEKLRSSGFKDPSFVPT